MADRWGTRVGAQTWLTGDPWANPEQRHLAHSMQELQMSIFKKCSYPKKKGKFPPVLGTTSGCAQGEFLRPQPAEMQKPAHSLQTRPGLGSLPHSLPLPSILHPCVSCWALQASVFALQDVALL